MMTAAAVLFTACFAPAADDDVKRTTPAPRNLNGPRVVVDDTSLDDVKRFTNDDHSVLKAKFETTQFFDHFLAEGIRTCPNDRKKRKLDEELRLYRRTTQFTYWMLQSVTDPKSRADERNKISTLRLLRQRIGETAYKAGGMPPVYPEKYEKEFRAWLEAKQKAGFTTPHSITEHFLAEQEKERQRLQKENEKQQKK